MKNNLPWKLQPTRDGKLWKHAAYIHSKQQWPPYPTFVYKSYTSTPTQFLTDDLPTRVA